MCGVCDVCVSDVRGVCVCMCDMCGLCVRQGMEYKICRSYWQGVCACVGGGGGGGGLGGGCETELRCIPRMGVGLPWDLDITEINTCVSVNLL